MKSAHEKGVTCTLFRELIMDFVDDELPEKERYEFCVHAEICPTCREELREIKYVRKILADIPALTVSPEFDFRLKASLRLEDARLRNPFYRLKLFLKSNFVPVVGIPAAAVLLIAGVAIYRSPFREEAPEIAGQTAPVPAPVASPVASPATAVDTPPVDVNYVLESLDLDETGIEVTPQGKPGVPRLQPDLKTVSLINF